MLSAIPILLVTGVQLVSAHFSITYPEWRGNSLIKDEDSPYSQWIWPCAGVPTDAGNRTDWPITGGALSVNLHHAWTYLYINLGLGNNVSSFNISLTPQLLNVTGKGDFCLPDLAIPEGVVRDGQNASIQVVTNGASGEALYNCADITLRANVPAHTCSNSSNIIVEIINDDTTEDDNPSAATGMTANTITLTTLVGLAIIFTANLGM